MQTYFKLNLFYTDSSPRIVRREVETRKRGTSSRIFSIGTHKLCHRSVISTPFKPTRTVYDIAIDELVSLCNSFSFKKTNVILLRDVPSPRVSQEITRLHSSRLADVRISEFNLGNMFSLYSKLCRSLVSLQSLFVPSPSQRIFFSFPHLFRRLPEATARTFLRSATTLREKRGIYIPVVKLLGEPARRSNTEYRWRTLISFCRSQTVSTRSNFRVSSCPRLHFRRIELKFKSTSIIETSASVNDTSKYDFLFYLD